jgi:membrane-associated phospholipid phosphatase
MATCSPTSLTCNALLYSQQVPAMVTAGCTALSWYSYNPVFFVYGFFLYGCQAVLWAGQSYFAMMRPVPFSTQYAFPSIEAFYVASVATAVLIYAGLFERRQGWIIWGTLFLLIVAPSFVLVFFGMHAWWQVLLSLLLGSVCTMAFIYILWLNLYQTLMYLQFVPPLSWMGFYGSTDWFRTNEALYQEHLELEKAFAR